MTNYNFEKDLPIAVRTEQEVAEIIRKRYNGVILEFCHNNAYDIKARINNKVYTFEVKEDFTCEYTNNVGVEFECRGKPSGISVSKADYYVYKIHSKYGIKFYIYNTSDIKRMIKEMQYFKVVNGGDVGSNSMNYLFKYDTFTSYGKCICYKYSAIK